MKIILPIVFILIIISSCNKFDKAEQRPAFLKIDTIELAINSSSEGTSNNKIVDAWVYVDDELVGTFDLPTTVPITKVGQREIKIFAGIKKNGISVDREKYPFFTHYTYNQDLKADSTYILEPTVSYVDDALIWVEDFEDPSYKLNPHQSDTTIVRVTTPSSELIEGGAGLITLNSSQYQCEMRTDEVDFNDMPTNLSTPGYIELNYKSNHELVVGVLANSSTGGVYERSPLITLHSTNNVWNKTYLYIPDASNFFYGAPEMDLYFKATNPKGLDNINIYLDNIKVIFWN